MMARSSEKVALVTGASRGIGAEAAARLARDGFTVMVNYLRHAPAAEALVARLHELGGRAFAIQADVSDPSAVGALFDKASNLGSVDVLVNNAGIQRLGTLTEMSDNDFDSLVKINLAGPFNMMRQAANRMQAGGRIINLSSGTTRVLQPRYGVYAATKAALEAMTAVLAQEMRGRNITVNAIAPGPVATELFLKGKSKEQRDHAANQSPLERLGEPADIASAISFLAGPDGRWVNGQTLFVNGAFI